MHWIEAVAASTRAQATRSQMVGRELVVYFRHRDGYGERLNRHGMRVEAHPKEVEGYLDWEPL